MLRKLIKNCDFRVMIEHNWWRQGGCKKHLTLIAIIGNIILKRTDRFMGIVE